MLPFPKTLWGAYLTPSFPVPLPNSPLRVKVAVVVGLGQRRRGGLRTNLRWSGRQQEVDYLGTGSPGSGMCFIVPGSQSKFKGKVIKNSKIAATEY